MKDCLFCKIINSKIPAEILYEDDLVIAFTDVHPLAPVHILVIPREHIASVNDVTDAQGSVMGALIIAAKKLAQEKGIAQSGYKLLIRTGADGGQEVPHIHLHLIGGAPLTEDIHPV